MARLAHSVPPRKPAEPLSAAALEDALRAADPGAFLVPPRILRRVIKQDAGVSGIGLRVPHRKSYTIARDKLLAIVDRAELDLDPDADLPEHVLLLARPTPETLASLSPDELLLKFWRLLFHARVHLALERRMGEGHLTDADVRERIRTLGEIEFEEIRGVLRQEDFLLPPRSDTSVYCEFVAVYLELRYFVPSFLRSYFPALREHREVDELLKRDLDGERLLAATRPAGAPDPSVGEAAASDRAARGERFDEPQSQPARRRFPLRQRSEQTAAALIVKADRVSALGNLVRAAILRTRAARCAQPETAQIAREKARAELVQLVRRLQAALSFTNNEADEWSRSLNSLLEQSALGIWTAEARMLYDLQKVCVDHERGIYTLDILGWLMSLGRKPIKRFLPGQRDVLISKHLRNASQRLPSAKLTQRARSRLGALLQSAVHRAEVSLRARFKPAIERALDTVKLLPQNLPERVARKKLIDEILDRIVERGFLSMSDLRDALSRNNLKLPDLASVQQFVMGDQLLQADKQLIASLDGVYRGGEIYLRLPQRLSSLAFGTPVGRFLTRYVALPFGGAFVTLEGLQHLISPAVHLFASDVHVHLMSPASFFLTGIFLLGLMQNPRFRSMCLQGVVRAGRAAHVVAVEWPTAVLKLPLVQRIVHSWQFRVFQRYVLKPLVISALATMLISVFSDREVTLRNWGLIFLGVNLILNSRIGRNVDEMVTDWVVQTWHRIRIHVFAALFRMIMDVFNRILETIERLLYSVDEWLRFRAGERRSATVTKAVLGFVWFFVNYVIRFCVNLLIEPQINPIKHFPVVTVSHKVMLPMTLPLRNALAGPLGTTWAWQVAGTIILVTPGVFGFLVWELKENWRLYAANRRRDLQPVSLGHHGETMLQLLRPGFRSGTVPKLYAKLRRASRKAYYTHNWKACTKHLNGLHHVEQAVRKFVNRELLELLHESRTWGDRSITAGEIRLGCNRILIELYCPDLGEDSMWLAFEEQSGWLVASIHRRGWADILGYPKRQTLASALAGFYKMAGVELVREQIEVQLEPGAPEFEVTDSELIVYPRPGSPPSAYYLGNWPPLDNSDELVAALASQRERWVFAATPIAWRRWVVTWELDQLGGFANHQVLDHLALLPD